MIKKITIEAVSIKKNKKDGTPYMYAEKDRTTRQPTGNMKPRTLVSIKDQDGVWYMGWSYKDGSAAETLKKGETRELFITEDGDFKNWRFVKDDDKKDAELAELRAKLAAFEGTPAPEGKADGTPAKKKAAKKVKEEEGEVDVNDIPF